jgi:lysophospholipase L1-like esterase
MVWLGDSTAAGVGATSVEQALPHLVASSLDRPVDVDSRAVSGDRVADVVADQLDSLQALRPDVVLISVGANDVVHLTSRADFRRTYEQMVRAIPDDAHLVLLGVPDMGAPTRYAQPLRATAGLRGRQLDEIVRDIASDVGATYVDIAGETGPTMRADTARYFSVDRFHPSEEGYRLWADAVVEQLAPILPTLDREAAVAHR